MRTMPNLAGTPAGTARLPGAGPLVPRVDDDHGWRSRGIDREGAAP